MRPALPIVVAALVIGLVTVLVREKPEAPPTPTPTAQNQDTARELAALRSSVDRQQRRIRELEDAHASLEEQLDALRRSLALSHPGLGQKLPAAAAKPGIAPGEEQELTSTTLVEGEPTPAIKLAVEAALKEQEEKRKVEREARQGKREQEWIDDTATRLNLDGPQKEKLGELLKWSVDMMQDAIKKRASGELPREDMRQTYQKFRAEWDTKLKSFLTEDQYKTYESMEGWEKRPPLWNRRRMMEGE